MNSANPTDKYKQHLAQYEFSNANSLVREHAKLTYDMAEVLSELIEVLPEEQAKVVDKYADELFRVIDKYKKQISKFK